MSDFLLDGNRNDNALSATMLKIFGIEVVYYHDINL